MWYYTVTAILVCIIVITLTLKVLFRRTSYVDSLQDIVDSDGKSVFITGCDTGFGHKIAKRLFNSGMKVYAGCLDANCEGAQCLALLGISTLQVDVTKQEQIDNAIDVIKRDTNNDLHAVVNNAGVMGFGEVDMMPIASFESIMRVNYMGTVRVTKACLPLLRLKPGSRVIIVGSLMSEVHLYSLSAYCASKAALEAFSSILRQEMSKWGVYVSYIQPGGYSTDIVKYDASKIMDNYWDLAPDETKQDYGKAYFDAYKRIQFPGEKDISKVIDALEQSIRRTKPMRLYRVGFGTTFLPTIKWLWSSIFESNIAMEIARQHFCGRALPCKAS